MPSAGFELAIPGIKRLEKYVVDRTATGIGSLISYSLQFVEWQEQQREQISPSNKMYQCDNHSKVRQRCNDIYHRKNINQINSNLFICSSVYGGTTSQHRDTRWII